MYAYQIETFFQEDGKLNLKVLPFHSGDKVGIIILAKDKIKPALNYPLKGKTVKYHGSPFDPATSESDWDILK